MSRFLIPKPGKVKALFTKRIVKTSEFAIDADEYELYDQLTRYVENQSIRAAGDDSARGRAVGFTMAMLQRRFASSIYAVRRSLERMKEKREHILEDPEKHRQEQIAKRLPDDFDELPEEEQQEMIAEAGRPGRLLQSRGFARGNRRVRRSHPSGKNPRRERSRK